MEPVDAPKCLRLFSLLVTVLCRSLPPSQEIDVNQIKQLDSLAGHRNLQHLEIRDDHVDKRSSSLDMDAHGSATLSIAIKIDLDQLHVSRVSIGFAQTPKQLARLQDAKENDVECNST